MAKMLVPSVFSTRIREGLPARKIERPYDAAARLTQRKPARNGTFSPVRLKTRISFVVTVIRRPA
ncbi:hypothetical protein [Qipengyuania nanhaisediminis]|uniref:hypothetical protein n=1 Tax=Qipengyuania nanhaisediminis TaxID=604088 RepID=UPI0038B29DA7